MSTIGSIIVNLSLDSSSFSNGLAGAQRSMAKAEQNVLGMVGSLQRQEATFGMTGTQAQLFALKQAGATDAVMDMARASAMNIDRMQAQAAAMARGTQIAQQYATPLRKYAATHTELNGLLARGAISQDVYRRALVSARSDLSKTAMAQRLLSGELGMAGPLAVRLGSQFASAAMQMAKAGAMIGAAVAGFAAFKLSRLIGQEMDAIDQTAKLSDRLGITTEALVGLQHASDLAGVSSEQLSNGIGKLYKTLDDARLGLSTATDAFDLVGIRAADISAMSPEDAFLAVADAIAKMEDPMQRNAAAMKIFGRAGGDLLPLMQSGAEGIRQAQAEAERLGLTFSRVDAAKVEQANDALTRMSAVFVGIGRTLAIELAPFIDALAVKFTDAAGAGEGMGAKVVTAFEWVVTGIAKAADCLELLKAGFYAVKTTVAGVFAYAVEITQRWAERLFAVLELIPGMGDVIGQARASLQGMSEGLRDVATESAGEMQDAWKRFNDGANSKAVAQTFADIRARAEEAAQAIADAAPKSGATPDAASSFAFDTTGAADMWGLGAAMKQFKAFREQADELARSVRTPTQVYQDEMERLNRLKAAGLDYELYLAGVAKAQDDLRSAAGLGGESRKADLKEQRFAFTYRAERQPNDPMLNVGKLQLAESRRQSRKLDGIERALARGASTIDIEQGA